MVFSPVGEGASQTSQPLVRMVDLQGILREKGEKKMSFQILRKNDGRETIPTPLKINMEHNHGGLEDHFPF